MFFSSVFRPSPGKVIIGAYFNFFDFRMVLQKLFQCVRRLFKTFTLYQCVFFRSSDSPKGKDDIYPSFLLPVSCVPVHQYTLHIRQLVLFLFQVEYKSCTFFSLPGLLHLESLPVFFIDSSQECISCFSRFIFPNKNSVMIRDTFIKDFMRNTIRDHFIADSSVV